MTVSDLIELLSERDPHLKVRVRDEDGALVPPVLVPTTAIRFGNGALCEASDDLPEVFQVLSLR